MVFFLEPRIGAGLSGYVAELTSAFVTAGLGLASEPHQQTAAYIAGWISLLKQDKRALFTAAAQASKAADYLTRTPG